VVKLDSPWIDTGVGLPAEALAPIATEPRLARMFGGLNATAMMTAAKTTATWPRVKTETKVEALMAVLALRLLVWLC